MGLLPPTRDLPNRELSPDFDSRSDRSWVRLRESRLRPGPFARPPTRTSRHPQSVSTTDRHSVLPQGRLWCRVLAGPRGGA
jgi:hypothetical protein